MNARSLSALAAVGAFALSVATLTHCELAVDLDRSEVDGAVPDGCAICSNPGEGGDDGGDDGATEDVHAVDGGDASAADAGIEAGSTEAGIEGGASDGATDAGSDGTPGDGGGEAASSDAGGSD